MSDPGHWTYTNFGTKEDLQQGDMLFALPEDCLSLKSIDTFFTVEQIRGYLVVSQTCDLVRRPKLNAECINLAVILSLAHVLQNLFASKLGYLQAGIFNESNREDTLDFIAKVVNQNEWARALFYLHPDLEAGITVHSVALLRFVVPIPTTKYDRLLKLRCGRLTTEFQNKLGWMTGNLFSRIGVPDWKEKVGEVKENELVNDILALGFPHDAPMWVNEKAFNKVVERHSNVSLLEYPELQSLIEQHSPPSTLEKVASRARGILKEALNIDDRALLKKFEDYLKADVQLEAILGKAQKRK